MLLLVFLGPGPAQFLPLLLSELVPKTQQKAGQLFLLDGLEQIVLDPVFERTLRILKLPVSADDDAVHARLALLGLPDEVQTAAARHPDIRHQQVGLLVRHQLQRPQSVVRDTHDLISQFVPVDQLPQKEDHLPLVIRQYHPQHIYFPRKPSSDMKTPGVLLEFISQNHSYKKCCHALEKTNTWQHLLYTD